MPMPLNEIVEFKHQVIHTLQNSQELISLMADDPTISLTSKEAAEIQENDFYDYSFSDETFQANRAVVFVEIRMAREPSYQFKGLKISVQVICNKKFANLQPKIFKGTLGNRRDNMCCVIASLLEDADDYGIGDLMLTSAAPVSVPNGFTGFGMEFTAVDFADKDDEYDD